LYAQVGGYIAVYDSFRRGDMVSGTALQRGTVVLSGSFQRGSMVERTTLRLSTVDERTTFTALHSGCVHLLTL
jgi:hypothetical protein